MYVDRGSREASKILSDRYLSNFMQTEAMRKQAAELDSAPFEGDEALKSQILKDTDEFIQGVAKKGDYENMTAEVVRAASNYGVRSEPLKKNKELYTAYNTRLDELVKDGKLPIENANNIKAVNKLKYQGLKVGENGQVDTSSYFSGMEPAVDPDVNKLLDEALKGIKTDSNNTVQRIVGANENGTIDVETESGIETISADRIDAVMAPVFQRADVRAFMGQSAELSTAVMPDDLVRGSFAKMATRLQDSIETDQAALAEESDEEKKAAIQDRIDNRLDQLNEVTRDLESDNLDSMRTTMATDRMHMEEMMMREAMQSKYGITKRVYKRKEFDNEVAVAKAGIPTQVQDVAIDYRGEKFQASSEYGNTFETMQGKINSDIGLASKYLEQLNTGDLSENEAVSYQRTLQNHLASANRGIDIMINEFGSTEMSEVDQEEFNRLLSRVADARSALSVNRPGTGGQASHAIQMGVINELRDANSALEDFVKGRGYERQQSTFTVSPIYTHGRIPGFDHSKTASEAEKNTYASLVKFFDGSEDGEFEIYKPGTNEKITLREWQAATQDEGITPKSSKGPGEMMKDGVPPSFKVSSIGFGTIAPNGMTGEPTIEVKFDSDYGGGSFRVPINDNLQVPGLSDWANSNYIKFKGDIEQRVGNGMKNGSVPYSTKTGKKGEMVFRQSPTGDTQVSFVTEGMESSGFMNINSKDFADFSNDLEYSYDMSSTLTKFGRDEQ